MTDKERQESSARRDEMRQQDHEAVQTMLGILRDVLHAHHASREATDRHRERMESKLDKQDLKIDRLSAQVGVMTEQFRQADISLAGRITAEAARPRFALFDGPAAKLLLGAAFTAIGIALAKMGLVPTGLVP